ncbi:MAG TPA: methylmalonyl-CoA mutase family protein, partial [Polyangiaceae bacterium]|nr:methylmalonyl-CoA mutase family protein [Polyangiaceae bacterium]
MKHDPAGSSGPAGARPPAATPRADLAGEVPFADGAELDNLRRAVARWRSEDVAAAEAAQPLRRPRFTTWSGIEVPDLLTPADVELSYERDLGLPGQFPFTRGVQPT